MKKRLVSMALLLVVCLVLTVPVSAAQTPVCVWLNKELQVTGIITISEGMLGVSDENGNCGFVNQDGEVVIPLAYSDISCYSEGLAAVGKADTYGRIKWDLLINPGKKLFL